MNAMRAAAAKGGLDLTGLQVERCSTDRTWGDRDGLVFFGAAPEVNERAAKFFEVWAHKNLRRLGAVGGYETQESIHFEGAFYFVAFDNGARGWHRGEDKSGLKVGDKPYSYLTKTEARAGFATSFVYYPCAD